MAITDLIDPATDTSSPDPAPVRWIDGLDRRLVNVLTAVGFGLPTGLFLWLVGQYSVNVVVSDQWSDVTVIRNSYTNLFDWSSLWAQHNENRIFFPNLIVIALSRLTHFDVQVEEYLSAAMLLAATALVILAHKRRSPKTPWLYYCPVAILMLSITQFGNMLWGFQMAWFLVLLAMAAALYLVDRPELTWLVFGAAMVAGIIGSFSSLQGLIIWPAGLVLLYHRRRHLSFVIAWVVVGVASLALYTYNFNNDAGAAPHHEAIEHPVISAKFFAFSFGDVLGIPFHFKQSFNGWIILLGLAIVLLAVAVVVAYGIRRDDQGGSPLGVALICMGLLFAATVTEGRVVFGAWAASASRYTTFDLLVPVGIYLALLDRPRLGVRASASSPNAGHKQVRPAWIDRVAVPTARVVIVVVIVVQMAFSIPNAVEGARSNYNYQTRAAHVLRNIDHSSDGAVVYYLYIFEHASYLRRQALTLQQHHLSVFAGDHPSS